MIDIVKSPNADSRSAKENLTKEDLTRSTELHQQDVRKGCEFLADLLMKAASIHDHTKIENMDDFFAAITGTSVKDSQWYHDHVTGERHHLKSHVPEDVNLIDVLECVVDCTMAGLARSGKVYDIDLDPAILSLAVQNTSKLIIDSTTVHENEDHKDLQDMEAE